MMNNNRDIESVHTGARIHFISRSRYPLNHAYENR